MNSAPIPTQLIMGLLQEESIGKAIASDSKYAHLHAIAGAESLSGDSLANEMIEIDMKAASTL